MSGRRHGITVSLSHLQLQSLELKYVCVCVCVQLESYPQSEAKAPELELERDGEANRELFTNSTLFIYKIFSAVKQSCQQLPPRVRRHTEAATTG